MPVAGAIKSARAAEPGLAEEDLLAMVSGNTGVPVRLLRTAIRYWASYPAEIDAEVAAADRSEELAEQAWQREQRLLAGAGRVRFHPSQPGPHWAAVDTGLSAPGGGPGRAHLAAAPPPAAR
jgi:hypothetical protein